MSTIAGMRASGNTDTDPGIQVQEKSAHHAINPA